MEKCALRKHGEIGHIYLRIIHMDFSVYVFLNASGVCFEGFKVRNQRAWVNGELI